MTATYVKVTLNLGDGAGEVPAMGSVMLTPSAQVSDTLDPLLVTQAQVQARFGDPEEPVPVAEVLAPDSPGLPSPALAYQVTFPGVPGDLASYYIQPFAGPVSFTATAGSPGIFTFIPVDGGLSELPHETEAVLSGGSLPGGFTPGTYYVANPAGLTFSLAAVPGGPALAATSGGSGQLTVTRYDLSSLTPAEPVDQFQGYLQEPAGSPGQGMAPLATGMGLATQWGFPAAQGSLPVPSGTAQPRQVPIATGTGQGTAWGTLTASDTGADAAGAAAAAQAASDPAGSATAAAAASLPVAQTFALANTAYKDIFRYQVTGQTDPTVKPFGWVAGSLTFTSISGISSVQGPAFWMGYNPDLLSARVNTSAHGAIGISCFGQAGDSFNPATGGRGLEFNMGFRTPNGLKATNFFEAVGCDDNTNTVTLSLRIGDGSYHTDNGQFVGSQFTLMDVASNLYMSAGPFNNSTQNGPGITLGAPIQITNLPYFNAISTSAMSWLLESTGASGNGPFSFQGISVHDSSTASFTGGTAASLAVTAGTGAAAITVQSAGSGAALAISAGGNGLSATANTTSQHGTAQFILNGNNTGTGVNAQMVWQKNSVNTWVMEDLGGGELLLTNNSGNAQMYMVSGSNATVFDNAQTTFQSKTTVNGSFVVNNGGTALATTATSGFLYIPVVAGTPTGTPAANPGTVALCLDTTTSRLWAYNGAWKTVTLS